MAYTITETSIIIGCDVGKTFHQLHVMRPNFEVVHRRKVANNNRQISDALGHAASLGDAVLVVDQKASFAALLRLCAAQHGIAVLYVTGLQARRASDLTPGKAKTDRIDAQVIAEFGRTHAHRLPTIELASELETQLRLLTGHDEDLRCDLNRTINRIRDLLTQYAPALEQALGRRVNAKGVLAALAKWGNPQALARARHATITVTIAEHNPRLADRTATTIRAAARQTQTQPGIDTAGELISYLADHAASLNTRRDNIGRELTALAETHDDYQLLISIPGMGPKTTVRFIAEIGNISKFPTGGHLASYAGLAPINRQSGTGLNTVSKDRSGNHRLKNALFLSAFVASRYDNGAAGHYERQRNKGKRHNAAVIAVARKRCDLIHAILTKRQAYQASEHTQPIAA